MVFPEAVEHFVSAALLSVGRVQNFEPAYWSHRIRRGLVLGDDALKIASANRLEKFYAMTLDMIGIKQKGLAAELATRGRSPEHM